MVSSIWSYQNQILMAQLKTVRKSAGFTQIELAGKLNKTQSYVSKYESGERRLDLIELKEIAENCGISLSAFITEFEKNI